MATIAERDAKKVFAPEDLKELLYGWLLHAHKGRARHDLAARRCNNLRYLVGGASTAATAIVGTSVFATLQTSVEKAPTDSRLGIVVAFVAIVAAILANLTALLNLGERADKHRAAGVRYKIIIRELEFIRAQGTADDKSKASEAKPIVAEVIETKPIVTEPIVTEPIEAKPSEAKPIEAKAIESKAIEAKATDLKKQLDDLEQTAPVVPERYYDQVEDEWKKAGVEFVPKACCLYSAKAGQALVRVPEIPLTAREFLPASRA